MGYCMTRKEHDTIKKLIDHGMSYADIRELTGRSYHAIANVKTGRYGDYLTDVPRRVRVTNGKKERIRELLRKGTPINDICRDMEVSADVVRRIRKENESLKSTEQKTMFDTIDETDAFRDNNGLPAEDTCVADSDAVVNRNKANEERRKAKNNEKGLRQIGVWVKSDTYITLKRLAGYRSGKDTSVNVGTLINDALDAYVEANRYELMCWDLNAEIISKKRDSGRTYGEMDT